MQKNNTTEKTREMMMQLQQSALHLAIGFERASKPDELLHLERLDLLRDAVDALRVMQLAVVHVAGAIGPGFTFEPNDHTHWMCIYCIKPLNTHIGRDCKCQSNM